MGRSSPLNFSNMGLFSKKKGGTFFGNLLAKVASSATGGILGGKRTQALEAGNLAAINPLAKTESKAFTEYKTTFAGDPATYDPTSQTYTMQKQLDEIKISAEKKSIEDSGLLKMIGDKISYLGGRATEQTKVGVDDKMMWLIGGGIAAVVVVMLATQKK